MVDPPVSEEEVKGMLSRLVVDGVVAASGIGNDGESKCWREHSGEQASKRRGAKEGHRRRGSAKVIGVVVRSIRA